MRRLLGQVGGWLAGAGLTAVLGYLIATNAAVHHPPAWPYWVFAGIALLGALLFLAGWLLPKIKGRRRSKDSALLTAHTRMHDRKGRLRKVRDSTDALALGVHPAAKPAQEDTQLDAGVGALPAYICRDAEDLPEVADAFAHGGLLIIEGGSAAGKTRMAYELMHRLAPGRWLIVPDNPGSLCVLKDSGVHFTDAIIWLDDINDYLAADGIDDSVLDALCPPDRHNVLLLATMRAEARRDLETPDTDNTISRAVRSVLNRGRIVPLGRTLSAAERRRAEAQQAKDPRIADALSQNTGAGFAEYLAAAPAVLQRWQSAKNGQNPAAAIIDAAVNARLAGYLSPLSRDLLRELHTHYLDPRHAQQPTTPGFDEALAWAIQPVKGASSALIPLKTDTYQVFDYLIDHALASGPKAPPAPVWPILLHHARDADLPFLSFVASRSGRLDIAEAAYRRAADTGHPVPMYNLAHLLSETDRSDEAEQWYRKAAASGFPPAMNDLANRLRETGRSDEAEQWYRKAAATGYTQGMYNLGNFLRETGRAEEAEQWCRKAASAGEPVAMNNLGIVLRELGRDEEAERWYRQAATVGLSVAMANLGNLLHDTGQREEAEHWYRKAIDNGNIEAMALLGNLFREMGRPDEAEEWYRAAIRDGDATASINLGVLLRQTGRVEEADDWYRKAAETGHPVAMVNLGGMLAQAGHHEEAEDWYRKAAEADNTEGKLGLGNLLSETGRQDEAEHWYRQAVEKGDLRAMNNLGLLLARTGRADEAERWYRQAAEKGHLTAMNNLAGLLADADHTEEAERWFRKAADTGHPLPMHNLGRFLRETGRTEEAEQWSRRAISADPAIANSTDEWIVYTEGVTKKGRIRREIRPGA